MRQFKAILLSLLSFLSVTLYAQDADSTTLDDRIFQEVESEASFPGGEAAWRTFLQQHLNPNVPVDNSAPVGIFTVMIQFIVDLDGSVSDIKPLTNLGYGMEQEVVRILKKSGAWTPAMQNGRPVKAYRKQPVTFMVDDDGFQIVSATPFVLYTGAGNEINVTVKKVKDEHVALTIRQGTITRLGDGKYIVRVNKPGRVIIEIHHLKKNKIIGSASFEVREGKEPK